MPDLIIIGGCPGSGKSTLGKRLQKRFNWPFIDFARLREFHLDPDWKTATDEEEQMSFESVIFLIKNYLKNGYSNVMVTDLRENRIEELTQIFKDIDFRIFSLILHDDEEIKRRVLTEERESGYRNYEAAIMWNKNLQARNAFPQEIKIDNTLNQPEDTLEDIVKHLGLD